MLLSIEGEEAVGKTTLAYTVPPPVVGFAFDMGVERALYGAKNEWFEGLEVKIVPYKSENQSLDGDITIYELPQPVQLDTNQIHGASELWAYFIERLVAAIQNPDIRSIVVDTMTIARRVKADAYLQELQEATPSGQQKRKQLIQIEWGNTNDSIRSIYTAIAGSRKNMVAVHHLTDERKESMDSKGQVIQVLTGNRLLEGLGQTYRFVDVAVRNQKNEGNIATIFKKCGYNLSLEVGNLQLENTTWEKMVQFIEDSLGGKLTLEEAHRVV